MNQQDQKNLIIQLMGQNECEWIEFKENFHSAVEIGERISALSNGACLRNQPYGYLIFGIKDTLRIIVGTTFQASTAKQGNEDLEHWLATRISPRLDFQVNEQSISGKHLVIYTIPAAKAEPVKFINVAHIRVGSITRKLLDFPDKESKIWKKEQIEFEYDSAKESLSAADIINLLSTQSYFELLKIPYPSTQEGVIQRFLHENLITKTKNDYSITNLGALLFAKNMQNFEKIQRKSIRVIVYKGKNKVETEREQMGNKGYAVDFENLVDWINSQLPANEEIGKALRQDTRMYPEIAIRELIANAMIHQDFSEKGCPIIEIFIDRIEISNPGLPLVNTDRFIDENISRNEKLADLMRRLHFCEERGSGIDKVIFQNELYQLPAINVVTTEKRTKATLYKYKALNDTDKKDKIRACYQHACLKYVSNEKMTNQSLRNRFNIDEKNAAIASRIIRDTIEGKRIKEEDPENKSRKYASYIPFWA